MLQQAGLKNSSLGLPVLDFQSDMVGDRTIMEVRCPNCGSPAERHHLTAERITRTQCGVCDYLMVTCSLTARVIEAYAPGRYINR